MVDFPCRRHPVFCPELPDLLALLGELLPVVEAAGRLAVAK